MLRHLHTVIALTRQDAILLATNARLEDKEAELDQCLEENAQIRAQVGC